MSKCWQATSNDKQLQVMAMDGDKQQAMASINVQHARDSEQQKAMMSDNEQ
jgi:hypothetical protein